MPTYEYDCSKCGLEFEIFQSMKDPPLKTCNCGKKGKVNRKIGRGAGLIFKGSGFYETDYKRTAETKKAEKNESMPPATTPATPTTPATTTTPASTPTPTPAPVSAAKTDSPAKTQGKPPAEKKLS